MGIYQKKSSSYLINFIAFSIMVLFLFFTFLFIVKTSASLKDNNHAMASPCLTVDKVLIPIIIPLSFAFK